MKGEACGECEPLLLTATYAGVNDEFIGEAKNGGKGASNQQTPLTAFCCFVAAATTVILSFLACLTALVAYFPDISSSSSSSSLYASLSSSRTSRRVRAFLFNGERKGVHEASRDSKTPVQCYTYEVLNVLPHDPNAFTEGLTYHARSGYFYESTGSEPEGTLSDVRKVDVETGKVIWKRHLPKRFFGEGLTVIPRNKGKEALVQLTWKESRAYVHDLSEEEGEVGRDGHLGGEDLESESDGEFFSTSLGDGWGVTNSNLKNTIIISNGTEHLTVFDVKERRVLRSVKVMDGGIRQKFINELEKVGTEIWANILERECIARIDENTGEILGWIDFTGLKNEPGNDGFGDVMNGIAYDDTHNRIYVTGKLWKSVFEVKIRKLEGKSADVLPITRMRCRAAKTLPNYGYE